MATNGTSKPHGREKKEGIKKVMYVSCLPPEILGKLSKDFEKKATSEEHTLLLETLDHMKDDETALFSIDPMFDCVRAFIQADLYIREPQGSTIQLRRDALASVDRILEQENTNLVVHYIKQELNQKTKFKKATPDSTIEALEQCDKSKANAFAIVAFYLFKLKIVDVAIELFEKAIEMWSETKEEDIMKVTIWKYYLAASYAQFMHKDHFTRQSEFNPERTMERIKELLEDVMKVGRKPDKSFLLARSYVDLALAFSKYQLIGIHKERTVQLPLRIKDVSECYEEAWKACDGQDPHVMEKFAQHLRKTACSTQTLKRAAGILKELLKKCSHRHVAAHQLALTYKYLWFEQDKLEHRFLFMNNVRRGKVEKAYDESKNARRRRKRAENERNRRETEALLAKIDADIEGGNLECDMEDSATAPTTEAVGVDDEVEPVDDMQDTSGDRAESMNPEENMAANDDASVCDKDDPMKMSVDTVTETFDRSLQTSSTPTPVKVKSSRPRGRKNNSRSSSKTCSKPILPSMPTHHTDVPKHKHHKPGYYHDLQADNPKPRTGNSPYLNEAKKYFHKANKITKETRVLYLVDLARIHLSCGESEEAQIYFERAKYLASRGAANHQDKAYLYEQQALMMYDEWKKDKDENWRSDPDLSEMSDAESRESLETLNTMETYFFKSIRSATKIKSKSRVAFYKLAALLERCQEKWTTLYLIYKAVGENDKASALLNYKVHALLDDKANALLENKDKTDAQDRLVRKLFKEECIANAEYDKFLSLCHSLYSQQPCKSLEQDIAEVTLLKCRQTTSGVCCKRDEEDGTTQMKRYADIGEALNISLRPGKRQRSPPDSEDEHCAKKHEPEPPSIVLMARSEFTEDGMFPFICNYLKDCEGVHVKVYYPDHDQLEDFPFGHSVPQQIDEFIQQAGIVIVSDFQPEGVTGTCGLPNILDVVTNVRYDKKKILVMQETDKIPHAWRGLRTVDVRPQDTSDQAKEDVFYGFLGSVFETLHA